MWSNPRLSRDGCNDEKRTCIRYIDNDHYNYDDEDGGGDNSGGDDDDGGGDNDS